MIADMVNAAIDGHRLLPGRGPADLPPGDQKAAMLPSSRIGSNDWASTAGRHISRFDKGCVTWLASVGPSQACSVWVKLQAYNGVLPTVCGDGLHGCLQQRAIVTGPAEIDRLMRARLALLPCRSPSRPFRMLSSPICPRSGSESGCSGDTRLSHDNSRSCASCHDFRYNGATRVKHDADWTAQNFR